MVATASNLSRRPFTSVKPATRGSCCRRHAAIAVRASGTQRTARTEDAVASMLDRRTILSAGALYAVTAVTAPLIAAAEGEEGDGYNKAPSGLEWKDVREGTGLAPVSGAMIRCHYTGKLASSGATFDSSYGRRPLSFKIGVRQVIAGWDEGILGNDSIPPMKEGGKRQLRIPPQLGYGARGAGGVIPPNATLLFDVELLGKR